MSLFIDMKTVQMQIGNLYYGAVVVLICVVLDSFMTPWTVAPGFLVHLHSTTLLEIAGVLTTFVGLKAYMVG